MRKPQRPLRKSRDFALRGRLWDVVRGQMYYGEVAVKNGVIAAIRHLPKRKVPWPYYEIMPGLVDAHIHVESTHLPPGELWRLFVCQGTVAAVCDPHEIANVCGERGVRWMIENAANVPFHFFFGAPSCVPATEFETSGASLPPDAVTGLLGDPSIHFLAEVMNYPAVLRGDGRFQQMIASAKRLGKPIDGHAPGLTGDAARAYFAAGPSTDHECTTLDEALGKIAAGAKIQIRDGSAARNFWTLHHLLTTRPCSVMLCTDDKHPHELRSGHINRLVSRALSFGHRPMAVLRAATLNPVRHYKLPVGLLQAGDPADFIVVNDLQRFDVAATYVRGELVAQNGRCLFEHQDTATINGFVRTEIEPSSIAVRAESPNIRVIGLVPDQLLTLQEVHPARIEGGFALSDPEHDVLKVVVVNRYDNNAPPAVGFVRGFRLSCGALASTYAHDSHNLIAVGADDESIVRAINLVVGQKGGLALVSRNATRVLPLPIAGLMSDRSAKEVARIYQCLLVEARDLGAQLSDPFMALSFLSLPVIPALKLTDKGLFDSEKFEPVPLFV
jgi:adenine deaminase